MLTMLDNLAIPFNIYHLQDQNRARLYPQTSPHPSYGGIHPLSESGQVGSSLQYI